MSPVRAGRIKTVSVATASGESAGTAGKSMRPRCRARRPRPTHLRQRACHRPRSYRMHSPPRSTTGCEARLRGEALCITARRLAVTLAPLCRSLPDGSLSAESISVAQCPNVAEVSARHTAHSIFLERHGAVLESRAHGGSRVFRSHDQKPAWRSRVVSVSRVASIAASLALKRATQGAPMSKSSFRVSCCAVSRLAITCLRLELAC